MKHNSIIECHVQVLCHFRLMLKCRVECQWGTESNYSARTAAKCERDCPTLEYTVWTMYFHHQSKVCESIGWPLWVLDIHVWKWFFMLSEPLLPNLSLKICLCYQKRKKIIVRIDRTFRTVMSSADFIVLPHNTVIIQLLSLDRPDYLKQPQIIATMHDCSKSG